MLVFGFLNLREELALLFKQKSGATQRDVLSVVRLLPLVAAL